MNRKTTFLSIKFEGGLFNPFIRKSMSKEKWHFSWGMVSPFSKSGVRNVFAAHLLRPSAFLNKDARDT
jgi:hypothetical protein